mgnify:CR=1 FL=1
MKAENGIEVKGLVREYRKGPRAVDGIDIEIAELEREYVRGPTGSIS